jgi:hypothetical protein
MPCRILSSKWLLLLACCAAGCHSPAPPRTDSEVHFEGGAHYAHLFGQHYRTLVDLYLFDMVHDPEYQYLGRNDGRPGFLSEALPPDVSQAAVGGNYSAVHILDVVPAGSELTIIAETHELTLNSRIREQGGYPLGFIARLNYKGKELPGVFCEFIQDATNAPLHVANQHIDEHIAKRINP